MVAITINNLFEFTTLFLVLVAIAISFLIILRTNQKICTCHKFLFAGLIVFGAIKTLNLLLEFKMIVLKKLIYLDMLEVVFVLFFIIGFWYIHAGIKNLSLEKNKNAPADSVEKQSNTIKSYGESEEISSFY